jgi:hypothetical protein
LDRWPKLRACVSCDEKIIRSFSLVTPCRQCQART